MVSVLITTYNSAKFLTRCLESIDSQTFQAIEVVVVDNASSDETRTILQQRTGLKIFYNDRNTGFAAAQNQAARAARGSWLLSLNPDVVLSPTFVETLVTTGELHAEVGTVCGKLLRSASLALTRVLITIGAPHKWVTPCATKASKIASARTQRRQTWGPATADSDQGMHQPLQ